MRKKKINTVMLSRLFVKALSSQHAVNMNELERK